MEIQKKNCNFLLCTLICFKLHFKDINIVYGFLRCFIKKKLKIEIFIKSFIDQ